MQKFNSKEFPTDHTNTTDKNSRRSSKFYKDLRNLCDLQETKNKQYSNLYDLKDGLKKKSFVPSNEI
jgi:hypothetical protein